MSRLPRPCLEPGCPNTVTGRALRCPQHALPDARHRDPEQVRYYASAAWRALRARVRREEPVCGLCQERPSEQVHHIDGDWRNNQRANLQAVCAACHLERSGRDHQARRGQPSAPPAPAAPPSWWIV